MSKFVIYPTLLAILCIIYFYKNGDKIADRENSFRIIFYNVENLYDLENDPNTNDDDFTPKGKQNWSEKRYTKKLEDIGTVINNINAGYPSAIVGLCEIENKHVVQDLLSSPLLKDKGYKYVITSSMDKRGSNIALLYDDGQVKMLHHQSYTPDINSDSPKYTRDVLHATGVANNNDTLDIFVCHFPSRGGGVAKTRPYRIIVAELVKHKVDSINQLRISPRIVIMGDFNDYPDDISIRKTLDAKSINSEIENTNLYNMFLHRANKTNEGSYKYQGKWKYIDQFIVNGNLLDANKSSSVKEKKAFVYTDNFLLEEDEKYGGEKPYRTYSGLTYLGGVSDHLPIYMDLTLK